MRRYAEYYGFVAALVTVGCKAAQPPASDQQADATGIEATHTGGSTGEPGPQNTDTDPVHPPIRLDVGVPTDVPGGGCDGTNPTTGDDGEVEYSYIWIANSVQGTISKINTVTLVEEGRYYTSDGGMGDPSRTSVNLSGDVAVANRRGGITKVVAHPDNCTDKDGDGTLETSSGPDDILPWGTDECVAWHAPYTYTTQRPIAWAPGQWDPALCRYAEEFVWTAGRNGAEPAEVLLLDGATGDELERVAVPEVIDEFYGLYGGAVDGEGNFWSTELGLGVLVRVDRQTFETRVWSKEVSSYGITVDANGYVWTCAYEAARFDPQTETWTTAAVGGSGGCMTDDNGVLWFGGSDNTMKGVDTETMEVIHSFSLPEYVHGTSIDFEGNVWGVSMVTDAYRVDPETGDYQVVTGLQSPYTYSDMTGFALKHAGTLPPAG